MHVVALHDLMLDVAQLDLVDVPIAIKLHLLRVQERIHLWLVELAMVRAACSILAAAIERQLRHQYIVSLLMIGALLCINTV